MTIHIPNTFHDKIKSMPKTLARDTSLDILRVISIVAVIVIHCIATMVLSSPLGSRHWIAANIIDSAVRWSVPVFVMISGALLIKRDAFDRRLYFLKKKTGRIILAIAIWPVIYLVWNWSVTKTPPDMKSYAYNLLTGTPAPGHLYFLFLIAGLYLLTPLISLYVSNVSKREVLVTTAIILGLAATWDIMTIFVPGQEGAQALNFATRGLPYIGYFMAGYVLKDLRASKPYLYLAGFVASVATLALITGAMSNSYGIAKGVSFYSFVSLPVIVMSLCFFISVREYSQRIQNTIAPIQEKLAKLSAATFGVYLMHIIVLSAATTYLHLNLQSVKHVTIVFAITLVGTFAVALGMLRVRFLRLLVS